VVERTAASEQRVAPGSRRLAVAVGTQLYRLTAYKDEYEVARLMTDPGALAGMRDVAVPGSRVAWKLHPPLLRALGLSHKLTIPLWTAPVFRGLARLKVLRGTPFDPFGYTALRRMERALPVEYARAIDTLLPKLSAERLGDAIALAELPDGVRGYEGIKHGRIERYREQLRQALASWE